MIVFCEFRRRSTAAGVQFPEYHQSRQLKVLMPESRAWVPETDAWVVVWFSDDGKHTYLIAATAGFRDPKLRAALCI